MVKVIILIILFAFWLSIKSEGISLDIKQSEERKILLYPIKKYNNYKEDSLYASIQNSAYLPYKRDTRPTNAHETSHGVNSDYSQNDKKAFLIRDQITYLKSPTGLKLSDIAVRVPPVYRGSRYQLYLKEQQRYFENDTLYIFDEWCCYLNGLEVAIEDSKNNKSDEPYLVDRIVPVIEFSIFSIILGKEIKIKYPDLYEDYKIFIKFNLNRSERLYLEGKKINNLNWDDKILYKLKTDSNSAGIRSTLLNEYNSIWLRLQH